MKTKEKETQDGTETKDSVEEFEKNANKEGEETGLEWGFGFNTQKTKETGSEERETDEGDDTPDEVEILKKELKSLQTQVQVDKDLEALKGKYNKKEGFPDVDKSKIINFLEGDFNKVPPMELGYIMANFADILKARDEVGAQKAKEKYSPEAVESQKKEAHNKKVQDSFSALGEKLKKRFGVQKKES